MYPVRKKKIIERQKLYMQAKFVKQKFVSQVTDAVPGIPSLSSDNGQPASSHVGHQALQVFY